MEAAITRCSHPQTKPTMRSSVVDLALQQAVRISPTWEKAQRDCAGLVRFTYRESLKSRTAKQRAELRVPAVLSLPAVSFGARLGFPGCPRMLEAGWGADGKERFGAFADAETFLIGFNFHRLSKDPHLADPGDLLVFESQSIPYRKVLHSRTI